MNSFWQEWVLETVWPSLMILSASGEWWGMDAWGWVLVRHHQPRIFPQKVVQAWEIPPTQIWAYRIWSSKMVGLGNLSENDLTFHVHFGRVFSSMLTSFGFIQNWGSKFLLPTSVEANYLGFISTAVQGGSLGGVGETPWQPWGWDAFLVSFGGHFLRSKSPKLPPKPNLKRGGQN